MSIREKIHSENEMIMVGGAWDVMSAIIAHESKFDAIWLSGLGLSISKKGRPDASIITMTDIVEVTYNITNVVSTPVIIDMDSGFGNAINIHYFIKELVSAGAAGVCIEDNVFPKSNSFYKGINKDLVSTREMQNKIHSAKDASNEKFVVIARNESLIVGNDLEEALERCYAYEEAGADGLVVHTAEWGILSRFLEKWNGKISLVCIPTKMPEIPLEKFKSLGYDMLIFANQALRASIRSSKEVMAEIVKSGLSTTLEKKISSVQEIFDLIGMDNLSRLEKKYLEE